MVVSTRARAGRRIEPVLWESASWASPRHPNQDRWLADGVRFAVADGCGGGAIPEWAATQAIRAAATTRVRRRGDVRRLFRSVDRAVRQAAARLGGHAVATTFTAAFSGSNALLVASIGNSRCWLGTEATDLAPLTRDDTDAEALGLGPGDPDYLRHSRLLTASIGNGDLATAAPHEVSITGPTVLLLTTDGVHDHLSVPAVRAVLAQGAAGAAARLVRRARLAGSIDDATAVVVVFDEPPAFGRTSRGFPRFPRFPRFPWRRDE